MIVVSPKTAANTTSYEIYFRAIVQDREHGKTVRESKIIPFIVRTIKSAGFVPRLQLIFY